MKSQTIRSCVALVGFVICGHALAQSGGPWPAGTKEAFRLAISQGYAETWASSMLAGDINRSLGRPLESRVRVKVRRLQQFNPECARLSMVFAAPEQGGKDLFEVQMNLCHDGSPPLEGVNLATPLPAQNSTPVPRLR